MLDAMYYILMNYWQAACGFVLMGAVICGLLVWIVRNWKKYFG